jgi:hypothetical protein
MVEGRRLGEMTRTGQDKAGETNWSAGKRRNRGGLGAEVALKALIVVVRGGRSVVVQLEFPGLVVTQRCLIS